MRSLRTFDALLLLADLGYGPQAMILARTFVEDTVTAWWVRQQDGRKLLALYDTHEKSVAARMQFPGAAPSDVLPSTSSLPLMTADQHADFVLTEDVDLNVAARHWTGKSVKQLANTAKRAMRPRDRARLDQLLGQAYHLSNLLTHNSPASLATTVAVAQVTTARADLTAPVFSRQPSTGLVHDALAVAYDSLSLLAQLVTDEGGRAGLDEQIDSDRVLFMVLPSDARPGRNDPCPCGSNTKYKHGHGRR